jgi:hypothetical protein
VGEDGRVVLVGAAGALGVAEPVPGRCGQASVSNVEGYRTNIKIQFYGEFLVQFPA